MKSIERKGACSDLFLVASFENKTSNNYMILPLVLISEESLEIAINAKDALFFGVAEMRLEFRIKMFFTLYFIVF